MEEEETRRFAETIREEVRHRVEKEKALLCNSTKTHVSRSPVTTFLAVDSVETFFEACNSWAFVFQRTRRSRHTLRIWSIRHCVVEQPPRARECSTHTP